MKLFLIGIFIAMSIGGIAQNYSFVSFSNNVGLPQSQVQCITQDDDGYLWIGTLGGLTKFNGKTFSSFPLEKGLYSNRISCMKHLKKSIFVGHEGGITVIKDNLALAYSLTQSDRTITVTDFIEFQGKIIASTEGGGIYIIHNNRLSKVSLPNEEASVCRSLEIISSKLVIGTRDGIYESSDLINFNQISALRHYSISGIVKTAQAVYVSTFYGGLFRTDEHFEKTDSIPIAIPDLYIGSIEKDQKNQLWLSSPDGIIRLDSKLKPLILDETNGFPAKSINCSFEDREGNMWFGSDGKGLIRFANQNLELFTSTTGLPSELILCGLKIAANKYLIGSYDAGAFIMDANGKCQKTPIPATTIWSIASFEGKTWYATNEGLYSWDHKSNPKLYRFSDVNSEFRVIKQVGKRLIVASENKIGYVQNNELIEYTKFKFSLARDGNIRDFTMYNSNLFVATSKGLYDINLANNTQKLVRHFNSSVSSIEVDADNRLWIGTESGLILYDGIIFSPLFYSSKSGAKFINFIQRIEEKQIIGTNDGIYIFDLIQNKPTLTKHIGTYNGLINLESNINSSMYENGNLWFGTTDGLAKLKMDFINHIQDVPPKLKITRILVNLAEIKESDFFSNLKLTHTRNNLIIELDGIDMDDPESIMYQYFLEGESEAWSPPTALSTIVLSNLDDGEYVLKVRAISGTKKLSEIQQFSFSITPPYWRTWWFYAICILVISLSIRYYFKLQINRERNRNYQTNLENKSRLLTLEQQSLNASMNRHFIFNSLNSIQYFINTQDRISANRYLTNFAKLIRKNLDSAAEGDNVVTLQQEMERLELYLSLESMRFKDRFEYRIENHNIDTEHVKVPAMLLQPFVENSIIHGILPNESQKGEIVITIKSIGGQLEICMDDNGIGIDFSLNKKAQFTGDHKSQGMEITSKRIDLIREMWNQNYELIGPFQMTNSDSSIKGTRVLIKIPYENLEMNN